eukprot:gb/GFBE01046556.1/.p1 GENE.gb/GFBE01046556.1/~~gb/GFBE01046556.1/.p1  ORF type:complete len:185 (+),score=19.36 gb/GFBE01046556.1/:1-555(+)
MEVGPAVEVPLAILVVNPVAFPQRGYPMTEVMRDAELDVCPQQHERKGGEVVVQQVRAVISSLRQHRLKHDCYSKEGGCLQPTRDVLDDQVILGKQSLKPSSSRRKFGKNVNIIANKHQLFFSSSTMKWNSADMNRSCSTEKTNACESNVPLDRKWRYFTSGVTSWNIQNRAVGVARPTASSHP